MKDWATLPQQQEQKQELFQNFQSPKLWSGSVQQFQNNILDMDIAWKVFPHCSGGVCTWRWNARTSVVTNLTAEVSMTRWQIYQCWKCGRYVHAESWRSFSQSCKLDERYLILYLYVALAEPSSSDTNSLAWNSWKMVLAFTGVKCLLATTCMQNI